MADHVFHRDFSKAYPIAVRGEGIYLYDATGKKYLDGSSGAIAVNLGYGIQEIVDRMRHQLETLPFAHTLRFETNTLWELSEEIAAITPAGLEWVYFTTGGSEANESAMKLARQYHANRGKAAKYLTIGRWQSYHGNTMGSLSVGGDIKRRQMYTPMLQQVPHVYSPNCRQCPFHSTYSECQQSELKCVSDLERLINEVGADAISAFICEPIVGSQQGAMEPPPTYLQRVREVCDKYDIVMILDEVMTGFGRTGANFALEHYEVVPDILTFGKGVSGGYAPLAGMVVSDKLVAGLKQFGNGRFMHGYTYSGHPVALAAGLGAVRYYRDNNVLQNCVEQSAYLLQQLHGLKDRHSSIADVRGKGLLLGLELVSDGSGSGRTAEQLNQIAMEHGAVFYPGSGTIDGVHGEHMLIAPPLTIEQSGVDELLAILDQSLAQFEQH